MQMLGELSDFMHECEQAPRLNEMASFFSSTAAGTAGVPQRWPKADRRLMQNDRYLISFLAAHYRIWGHFDPHYFSSIPYRLEEEARLGAALLQYGLDRGTVENPLGYYVLGAAEGTFARTLARMAAGAIRTLSCSPNKENEDSFYLHGRPDYASFFLGPFHRLTPQWLATDSVLKGLHGKFDIVLEDTTFQMYSPNRHSQIGFVKSYLKDDGVFIFIEKFLDPDLDEYVRREMQKDYGYKARFFLPGEIEAKNETVLKRMDLNQVNIDAMSEALREHFRYACVTWNSGNFYTITASNDSDNLRDLVASMCPPCIPNEYSYLGLPQSLSGCSLAVPSFREAIPETL